MDAITVGQHLKITRKNEWVKEGADVEVLYVYPDGQRINVLVKKEDQHNDNDGQAHNAFIMNIADFTLKA